MLYHSFVLDALSETVADTFSHFEELFDEHYERFPSTSRLRMLVPTIHKMHTRLPLRKAFLIINERYGITSRTHVCISFNELRHVLNLAQIIALAEKQVCGEEGNGKDNEIDNNIININNVIPAFHGPAMITLDGDQTLYADGSNFSQNDSSVLADCLIRLLNHGVIIAVVTAAGYGYDASKYEVRLDGLLACMRNDGLSSESCKRFYLMGGECNYLLRLDDDYHLHPVEEGGSDGWWMMSKYSTNNDEIDVAKDCSILTDSPACWKEGDCQLLLDEAQKSFERSVKDQHVRGRVIRKKRAVGLIPLSTEDGATREVIPREALDETVLRTQDVLRMRGGGLPFCVFNGGNDAWVDVGNKRVGVQVLTSYLNIPPNRTLHVGDQFLNTGNDHAARDICPCVWITSPFETADVLKYVLRLGESGDNVVSTPLASTGKDSTGGNFRETILSMEGGNEKTANEKGSEIKSEYKYKTVNCANVISRDSIGKKMDVYTGEIIDQEFK